MARKFVISPTKLRTFYQCPAQYRLEYIDKLGRFYHKARAGFSFGHSLHRALDTFHNAGGAEAVSAEALGASLDTLWVKSGYDGEKQETAYKEEATRILQSYHAASQTAQKEREANPEAPPPPQILWTEKTLRVDLSPYVALSGRIDRVDEHHDGTLEIVDYKSGRQTVTEADVAGALAMNIYQLLVKHQMPARRVVSTIVALRSGDKASHEMSDTDRSDLQAACLETGEALRTKEWTNVLPVICNHCPYCDFLPYCTRYWKQEARRNNEPAPEIPEAA